MATLAVSPVGCGGETERATGGSLDEQSGAPMYQDARLGYSVRLASAWHRAPLPVSQLADPRELVALATFPLARHLPTNCEAFAGSARSQMDREDVFLVVQERGYDRESEWLDFPPRPRSFSPEDPKPAEPGEHGCGDPPDSTVYWRNFSDAGRHFHTLVVMGPDAPPSARTQAWAILDSLRFDSDRRPNWPASP
jgi:hypothetical protein